MHAGHVMNGPVSWLNYAFRFMQLPLGLFGVAIASATLPAISRSAAAGDMREFRETLSAFAGAGDAADHPFLGGPRRLGREHDRAWFISAAAFTASDTHQTAWRSPATRGLTGYAAVKVLAPAFYALNDARTPMLVSLVSVGNQLRRSLHHGALTCTSDMPGLALSTSAVALFNFLVLLILIRGRIGGIEGGALCCKASTKSRWQRLPSRRSAFRPAIGFTRYFGASPRTGLSSISRSPIPLGVPRLLRSLQPVPCS